MKTPRDYAKTVLALAFIALMSILAFNASRNRDLRPTITIKGSIEYKEVKQDGTSVKTVKNYK